MAKMNKTLRRTVFENAIEKLYGDRLVTEKQEFERTMEGIVLKMARRTAKQNGVDYEALTTIYKPYIGTRNIFYFETNSGRFNEELSQIFYNENSPVMGFEDAHFELVQMFQQQHVYQLSTENHYPYINGECFDEYERADIIAAFIRYAEFMKGVIDSACAIRDVINSSPTTKQLVETSPELGELLPKDEVCTTLVPVETVNRVSALFAVI
jgi:hypothetical protein